MSAPPPSEKRGTLIDHLRELRTCLIRSLLALGVGMIACLFFSKEIFHFLQQPLLAVMPAGSGFIATSPLEGIMTYFKVSLLAALFVSSPVILYQVWRFVAPALYVDERRLALFFVLGTTLFFVGGALFGYFVIFPIGFRVFVSALAGTGIQFLPQMKDYLGFIARLLLTFGLLFEMPLLMAALSKIGLIRREVLTRARRYVIVGIFLIAGMLTPGPDVLSQLLLAIPLLGLYELSILLVRVLEREKN